MTAPKKQILYQEILDRLVTGRYRFGERILVKELAEETGASRQPIMAALTALSMDGFLKIIPQVGCDVINPTLEEISDFYKMFGRMEGLLAELAAARRTSAQLATLKEINTKIGKLSGKSKNANLEYRKLNQSFHQNIHAMADSPLLDAHQATLFAMSDFFIMQTVGFSHHLELATEEHEGIILAIERRRSEAARTAAEQHIESVAKAFVGNAGAAGANVVRR